MLEKQRAAIVLQGRDFFKGSKFTVKNEEKLLREIAERKGWEVIATYKQAKMGPQPELWGYPDLVDTLDPLQWGEKGSPHVEETSPVHR